MVPKAAEGAPPASYREVVVGSGSTLWRHLRSRKEIAARFATAIGHAELGNFAFSARDRVWVFAYSRRRDENSRMISHLATSLAAEIVYVSSSSTAATRTTRCYRYPFVKQCAEDEVAALQNGRILTLGLVYSSVEELPSGDNVATSYEELAAFLAAPTWTEGGGRRRHLLGIVRRPFAGPVERLLYRLYGRMMSAVSPYACALRPVDLVLRALGMRWYGYGYLSNRAWISTIS